MNLGVSLIPFEPVRLLQSMTVGLVRRVESLGILKIVDSAVENVVGWQAGSSSSIIHGHNGIASVAAHGRVALVKCIAMSKSGNPSRYAARAFRGSFAVDPSRYHAKPRKLYAKAEFRSASIPFVSVARAAAKSLLSSCLYASWIKGKEALVLGSS